MSFLLRQALRQQAQSELPPGSALPDKNYLHGDFLASTDREVADRERNSVWREEFAKRLAYKSVDMALPPGGTEGMNISTNKYLDGVSFGLKEILAVGAIALSGMGLWKYLDKPTAPPTQQEQPTFTDTDSAGDLKFVD